jgi:hypothetical protein
MACGYGLVLLENGRLIDTLAGETIPADVRPMPRTTAVQVAALKRATAAEAERLVWRSSAAKGVTSIIGEQAPLRWPHPFSLDRLNMMDSDIGTPDAPEVLFVQSGSIAVELAESTLTLGPGDTMTVPVGIERRLSGPGSIVYRVSG